VLTINEVAAHTIQCANDQPIAMAGLRRARALDA